MPILSVDELAKVPSQTDNQEREVPAAIAELAAQRARFRLARTLALRRPTTKRMTGGTELGPTSPEEASKTRTGHKS